jgi:hypothetical protein
MRKLLLLFALIATALNSQAQYSVNNSFIRKALVIYKMDSKGFYQKSLDIMLDYVDGVTENYAYDKKAQTLYVLTSNSNCAITLNKDYAKVIKRNKSIPQLDGKELENIVRQANNKLVEKFEVLNRIRECHIADSIEQSRRDSIERVRKEQLRIAQIESEHNGYRQSHNWHWTPTTGNTLSCSLCENTVSSDSVFCIGILNDSIYYGGAEEGMYGYNLFKLHACKIPSSLLNDSKFRYHYEVFKDSLSKNSDLCPDLINALNYHYLDQHIKEVKRDAPYGFFEDWGWNDEYSVVTFNFEYTNMNVKTIHYIDVYFRITNDVGDVRMTGHFKGTGPLKELETASWNWDSSSYYVAGDASNAKIVKVILTYMNGSQKVLTGNMIKYK